MYDHQTQTHPSFFVVRKSFRKSFLRTGVVCITAFFLGSTLPSLADDSSQAEHHASDPTSSTALDFQRPSSLLHREQALRSHRNPTWDFATPEEESVDEDDRNIHVCSLAVGELGPSYFEHLGTWQKRYGRDNLSLAEHFLVELFFEKILPRLAEALLKCPVGALEIMMNGVLYVDTVVGKSVAAVYLEEVFLLRDLVFARLEERLGKALTPQGKVASVQGGSPGGGFVSAVLASGQRLSVAVLRPTLQKKDEQEADEPKHGISEQMQALLIPAGAPAESVQALREADDELLDGDLRYQYRNLRALMREWSVDIAYVYPKLLGPLRNERLGPLSAVSAVLAVFADEVEDLLKTPEDEHQQSVDFCLGQRFYVYPDLDPTFYQPGLLKCLQGQWGSEVLMKAFLERTCSTKNPEEADWFYVGLYGTCRYVQLNEGVPDHDGKMMESMDSVSKRFLWEPLALRLRKSYWWQRREGRDHIFLFADGQGPRIWDSYDFFRSSAVFMSPEATCPTWGEAVRSLLDVKLCLSPWKDIIIPGHTDYARLE